MGTEKKIAIVIGAGPAGLTAAAELRRNGFAVTVLEADSQVGGLCRTIEYQGNRLDLGGHRFFSKDPWVNCFWRELMPLQGKPASDDLLLQSEKKYVPGGPDPEKDDEVMLLRRRVSRILYDGKFFDYPVSLKLETVLNMGLCRTVKAGFSYLWAAVFRQPEKSLREFMINRFGEVLYRMFFEKYTEKLWGKNPSEISASWGAQRIKGVSLTKAVLSKFRKLALFRGSKGVESSLIEEFLYPKKGPGQLWELLSSRLEQQGCSVIRNAEVTRFELKSDRTVAAVYARLNGKEKRFDGDVFLSSMPVKDLIGAFPAGAFTPEVRQIAGALPYRDFITVGMELPQLALKNRTRCKTVGDVIPDCWIYVQDPGVRLGRLQIFNNWSPYLVREPEKKVWIGLEYFCAENDELWQMSDPDFIAMATEELRTIGVIGRDVRPEKTIRLKVKKAYPAYFGSYDRFDTVRNALDGINNLYCIGRNGQHRYNNMDHSMLTAKAATELIVSGQQDKTPLWKINTADEYHEEA